VPPRGASRRPREIGEIEGTEGAMTEAARDVGELCARLPRGSMEGAARPALTFYRGRTVAGWLTAGELAERVDRLAAHFASRLGVRRGERIALASANRLEVPLAVLALFRLGAIAVPLSPTVPEDDAAYVLEHAGVRGLVAAADVAARLGAVARELDFVMPIEDALAVEGGALDAPLGALAGEPAVILYTSGTTGRPKGVTLTHGALLANARAMAARFGLAGSTQLAVLPLHHAHALGFGLMTSLATGGHLVFTSGLDPFTWADVVQAERVEVSSVVPTLLGPLLAARVRAERVPSLRALLVSSAPLPVDLARRFEAETRLCLAHGWGLSEYTNFACCIAPGLDLSARAELLLGGELLSIGGPLDGTDVAVMDDEGREVEDGARGELCVRGPCKMLGYYGDPEATRRTLRDGWLRTGDEGTARAHPAGRMFWVTGRIKELIVRGGEKLHPLAVERRIAAALPTLDGRMAVVGFPHRAQGEEIGVYVEAEALTEGVAGELVRALEALPAELRPKVVVRGAAPIPRTHTGKVQRAKLAPWFAGLDEVRGPVRVIGG
jgi:long-chain acyl-CoA synthetase